MRFHFRFAFFTLLLVGLASVSAFAQQPSPDQLLDKARKTINGFPDVTVEFTKSLKLVNGSTESYSGTLVLKKKRYIFHLDKLHVYSDGQTVWTVDESAREVTINNVDPDEAVSPDRIFNISRNHMRTRYDGEETVNGKACNKITLFPLQTSDYVSITVWLDKAENLPRQVLQQLKTGTKVTYVMKSIVSHKNVPDASFKLNPQQQYPGFHVEDLR